MVKADKRELKIRQNPKNVSLADFEWLINQYGYIKAGGRHALAVIGGIHYSYPRNSPVHYVYVKALIELIDKEEK